MPSDFNTNAKDAAAYLRRLLAIGQQEMNALHVNPPFSIRPLYIRYFGDLLREELLLVLAGNQASNGQGGYVQQYQSARRYQQQTLAPAARQLGLSSCAS